MEQSWQNAVVFVQIAFAKTVFGDSPLKKYIEIEFDNRRTQFFAFRGSALLQFALVFASSLAACVLAKQTACVFLLGRCQQKNATVNISRRLWQTNCV